ncbi:RAD55 family ATPase [Comamonas humi]
MDELAMQLILKASRVVIDSLSGFELALAPTFKQNFRESLSRLVSALASTGATILMTSELEDRYGDLRFSPYGSAFLTDAIIVQRYIEVDSRLQRVMAVVKLRDSAHSNELRQFHIDDKGLQIGIACKAWKACCEVSRPGVARCALTWTSRSTGRRLADDGPAVDLL